MAQSSLVLRKILIINWTQESMAEGQVRKRANRPLDQSQELSTDSSHLVFPPPPSCSFPSLGEVRSQRVGGDLNYV